MPAPRLEKTAVIQAEFEGLTDGIDWGDDADDHLVCPVNPDGPCEVCD